MVGEMVHSARAMPTSLLASPKAAHPCWINPAVSAVKCAGDSTTSSVQFDTIAFHSYTNSTLAFTVQQSAFHLAAFASEHYHKYNHDYKGDNCPDDDPPHVGRATALGRGKKGDKQAEGFHGLTSTHSLKQPHIHPGLGLPLYILLLFLENQI